MIRLYCIRPFLLLFLFLILLRENPLFAQSEYKKIIISGLRIYSEELLVANFNLNRLPLRQSHFMNVATEMYRFYKKRGYVLVKIYLIEETDDTLSIHVDEGRLGRIVFHGLNSIDTLKIRYDFELKKKVYNEPRLNSEIRRLRKKYGFRDIHADLVRAREYDDSLIQLDREFDIFIIGPARLPFFDQFGYDYDLKIRFVKHALVSRGITYGFKTSYTKGLIPYAGYLFPSLFSKDDLLDISASMGILYGIDLDFATPPHWTFMEVRAKYNFTPTLKNYFTPRVEGSVYRSRSSRTDIGLSRYEYLQSSGVLVPGITVLKKWRIYAGYGGEKVLIYESAIEPDAAYTVNIEEHTELWNFFEFGTSLDIIPWTLKRTIRRDLNCSYKIYKSGNSRATFQELLFTGNLDFEFGNFDMYHFDVDYSLLSGDVPFYHEVSVESSNFKGFMGKSYHTWNIVRIAQEYRISLYRDFLFAGLFVDWTWFEGSGYDISGDQYGIVSGIAGHILFLDQFEFNVYFGKDYLFSTGESQFNIKLSACKKW